MEAVPELFKSVAPDVLELFKNNEPRPERVIGMLEYKKKDVAAAAGLTLSSIRYDSKMPEELRDRLREWATALNLVGNFFQDEQRTLLWFRTRNHLLGGLTPRDMIRMGRFLKLLKFIHTALEENQR